MNPERSVVSLTPLSHDAYLAVQGHVGNVTGISYISKADVPRTGNKPLWLAGRAIEEDENDCSNHQFSCHLFLHD